MGSYVKNENEFEDCEDIYEDKDETWWQDDKEEDNDDLVPASLLCVEVELVCIEFTANFFKDFK